MPTTASLIIEARGENIWPAPDTSGNATFMLSPFARRCSRFLALIIRLAHRQKNYFHTRIAVDFSSRGTAAELRILRGVWVLSKTGPR